MIVFSEVVTVVAQTDKCALSQCGAAEVVYVVVKTYLDLDVLGALKQYKGPVLLARRRRDEMISTQLVCFDWLGVLATILSSSHLFDGVRGLKWGRWVVVA